MDFPPSLADIFFHLIIAILTGPQMGLLLLLIGLDLVLGIAAALKQNRFEWAKVATFYRTNVLPYTIGYFVLHIAIAFALPPEALGGAGELLSPTLAWAAWGILMSSLTSSISSNLATLYGQAIALPAGITLVPKTAPEPPPLELLVLEVLQQAGLPSSQALIDQTSELVLQRVHMELYRSLQTTGLSSGKDGSR